PREGDAKENQEKARFPGQGKPGLWGRGMGRSHWPIITNGRGTRSPAWERLPGPLRLVDNARMKERKPKTRRSPAKDPRSPWLPLAALVLASAGQALMARRDQPWTLWAGLLCDVLAFGAAFLAFRGPSEREGISPAKEKFFLFLILALTVFFRTYHLSQIPSGIARDESSIAVVAQEMDQGRVPSLAEFYHSAWTHYTGLDAYYGLAAWFHFFPASRAGLISFYVLFALLSLFFAYGLFKRLLGVPAALTALFFLSVMQWPVTLSRNGHPAQLGLCAMTGGLYFLEKGIREGKSWCFLPVSLCLTAGLYGYPAFKVLPLLVVSILLYEVNKGEKPRAFLHKAFFLTLGPYFLLGIPLWMDMADHGEIISGPRYDNNFIGTQIMDQGSLMPLFGNLGAAWFSLVRQGDPSPTYNLPLHRLLDDGMGALLVLGIAGIFSRIQERASFYLLAAVSVMAL